MRRLKLATGVEFKFHDLRRTAASHMAALGVARFVIARLLNHVDSAVTAVYDRYSYDLDKTKALQLWDRRLDEIACGKPTSNLVRVI
jgi:integrase